MNKLSIYNPPKPPELTDLCKEKYVYRAAYYSIPQKSKRHLQLHFSLLILNPLMFVLIHLNGKATCTTSLLSSPDSFTTTFKTVVTITLTTTFAVSTKLYHQFSFVYFTITLITTLPLHYQFNQHRHHHLHHRLLHFNPNCHTCLISFTTTSS